MKKIKSQLIFEDPDLPMSLVRLAILKGTGVDVEELRQKPMIAVVNSHTELNPGHTHLNLLAERVKEGIHAGGGIAAVRDGDEIVIDIPGRTLELKLPETEIKKRLKDFKPLERGAPPGYMRRYREAVSSPAQGAVLR